MQLSELKIVDFHTHLLMSPAAARRATERFAQFSQVTNFKWGFKPRSFYKDQSFHQLLTEMRRNNIDRSVVLTVVVKPEDVHKTNVSILEFCAGRPEFIPFGALHPKMADYDSEIAFLLDHHLRGVKNHSYLQWFDPINPAEKMKPYYQAIAKSGLILLVDAGDSIESMQTPGGFIDQAAMYRHATTMLKILKILDWAPDLKIVVAHMGGLCSWAEVLSLAENLKGTNVHFDTSYAFYIARRHPATVTADRLIELISRLGHHRFLYGSDFPQVRVSKELNFLFKCLSNAGFDNKELPDIFSGNALRLLNMI